MTDFQKDHTIAVHRVKDDFYFDFEVFNEDVSRHVGYLSGIVGIFTLSKVREWSYSNFLGSTKLFISNDKTTGSGILLNAKDVYNYKNDYPELIKTEWKRTNTKWRKYILSINKVKQDVDRLRHKLHRFLLTS